MTRMADTVTVESGRLLFDGVDVAGLAGRVDTPFFLYSQRRILENVERLRRAFETRHAASRVFFAGKVSRLSRVTAELSVNGRVRTYRVQGQIFFASAGMFAEAIDVVEPVERIVIDVSEAHFWDISAIGALDRLVLKARRHGHAVDVIGLNEASATMVERFGTHRNHEQAAASPRHP